jgi:hypothetical protein
MVAADNVRRVHSLEARRYADVIDRVKPGALRVVACTQRGRVAMQNCQVLHNVIDLDFAALYLFESGFQK